MGTEVWETSRTVMSHSHQISVDLHGPTGGTSEAGVSAGEAKNEAGAAHVGLYQS